MTNYLDLNEYLTKEKLISQRLKNDWKYYKKHGAQRPFDKITKIINAKKNGVSIH